MITYKAIYRPPLVSEATRFCGRGSLYDASKGARRPPATSGPWRRRGADHPPTSNHSPFPLGLSYNDHLCFLLNKVEEFPAPSRGAKAPARCRAPGVGRAPITHDMVMGAAHTVEEEEATPCPWGGRERSGRDGTGERATPLASTSSSRYGPALPTARVVLVPV